MESDYDLIATQQFLGHADPSTTRKYIGLDTAKLVEYSEKLSDYLRDAIFGKTDKYNTSTRVLHFSKSPKMASKSTSANRSLYVTSSLVVSPMYLRVVEGALCPRKPCVAIGS